jgi:hypothetical protein
LIEFRFAKETNIKLKLFFLIRTAARNAKIKQTTRKTRQSTPRNFAVKIPKAKQTASQRRG